MYGLDRKIAEIVQRDARISNAEIAAAVGTSVSTASERVRRLIANGGIAAWRAVLDPDRFGAGLLAFVFVDITYEGEREACEAIARCREVQEMHHVSGARSYLLKVRVADTHALQAFLQEKVKPLAAVTGTETIVVLDRVKETSEILIPAPTANAETDG